MRSRYGRASVIGLDIGGANLKAATHGQSVDPYLPAITPGTVEHWLWNEHYADDESFLFAIADA